MEMDDLNVPEYVEQVPGESAPNLDQEEADFLKSLESESTATTGTEPNNANDDLETKAATGTALMLINTAEAMTKQLAHPAFKWQDAEKQNTAEAIAPAIVKNGGQMPEWLEPYKEEVFALLAVGVLAFGGYMQVKQLKQLDEAQAKPKDDEPNSETLNDAA
ncbi:hypothetical protein [Vibrio phage vB_VruC_PG21]|uniref:Uncharacterized protein n=1 Tax=Vibrio phage vB_VruC_PG21 TaxID=2928757 RepID=A0AAE9KE60_9VIRU|nr:hypothetical protein [Vibrio sp. CK2-1]MCF7355072.1 hypothetical protein [Vibrio sp. CK2-1]UOL48290.1 hypothetical protein [Vibrio phage vB_VruC_PG21]